MNGGARNRLLAVIAVLVTACGSANPAAKNPTPSALEVTPSPVALMPSPTSSPSPDATVSPRPSPSPRPYVATPCVAPTNRDLVLVTLRGSIKIVVRDVTDISNPKTVGALGTYPSSVGASAAMEGAAGQFVCQTEISYLLQTEKEVTGDDGLTYSDLTTYIYRVPLSGLPKIAAITAKTNILVFTWSRDGRTLLYVAEGDLGKNELHELRGGVDKVIASLPPLGVGGCESYPCPGPFQDPGDKWDVRVSFSPDGTHISVVQWGIERYLRIWSSNGKLLTHSDSLDTSMSIWSGSDFYFRDPKGVERWHNGAISTFLPGVAWIRPRASADGRQIVYAARDAQRVAHVFIVDTATGIVRDLGKGRAEPAFLTPRFVWYQAETTGYPGIASGKTYIYDLEKGTETSSVITSVVDVWPHAA